MTNTPPAPPAEWTYTLIGADGQRYGPVSAETLVQWAAEGRVGPDSLIAAAGDDEPRQARTIPSLARFFEAPPTYSTGVRHHPEADAGVGALIPYRNGAALSAYYLGVFSLIPIVGLVLGPVACYLGFRGLRYARENPQAKGRVHAYVGVVIGGVITLLHLAGIALIVIAAAA